MKTILTIAEQTDFRTREEIEADMIKYHEEYKPDWRKENEL